jgi:soluble lytic murein transglycosylase-like protein
MSSSIDQKPPANLPAGVWVLWLFIIAVITIAQFFFERQKGTDLLYQKQNLIEPANEMPVISGGKPSGSFPKKDADTSSENTSSSARVRKIAFLFQSIILQTAKRYRIDPALIRAIIMAESGYNPNAVSRRGARGLMQLMPETAESLGVADSFNPEHNIKAGVKYFKQLLIQFEGDVTLALSAYNAGARKVRKHKGVPPFKATRHYIRKVDTYYQHYKVQMALEEMTD